MGDSSKPADSDLEKTLRGVSGCKDKAVRLFFKQSKKGPLKNVKEIEARKYGKVIHYDNDEIHFIQGTNGKKHDFDIIPLARILKVEVYTLEKSVKRNNYEQ